MADKSNAMAQGHALWQRVFREVAAEFPASRPRTSTSTRWCCRWCGIPAQFEVIVTNNLFGDIITDLGAALQGGLGMAASANVHPGQDVDVRAGARLRAAAGREERRQPDGRGAVGGLMLAHLGLGDEAAAIEHAVRQVVAAGIGTAGHRRNARHSRR